MYILNKELVKIHPLYLYFVLKFYPFFLLPLEDMIKLKLIPSMSTDKGKDPAYQTRYQERVAASQEQTQVPPPEQSSSTQGFDIQLSTGTTLRNPTPPPPCPYYDHYIRNGYYASLAKSGKGNRYRLTLLQRCSALSVTFGFSDSDDTSYHRLFVVCSSWSW